MRLTSILPISLAALAGAATSPATEPVPDLDPADRFFEWEADLPTTTTAEEEPGPEPQRGPVLPEDDWSAAAGAVPFRPPKIGRITYSGNGCRQGSATPPLRTGGGWRDLGFLLPDFAVSYDAGGGGVAARTANCQVHLDLVAGGSPGWQVGVKRVWSRGRAELDPGVALKLFVTVYYSHDAGNTVRAKFPTTPLLRSAAELSEYVLNPSSILIFRVFTGIRGANVREPTGQAAEAGRGNTGGDTGRQRRVVAVRGQR